MNSSYFNIFTSLSEASLVVKLVLLILLILSIYSWAIIFSKIRLFIQYSSLLKKTYMYTKESKNDTNSLIQLFSKHKNNPYSNVLTFCLANKFMLFKDDNVNPMMVDTIYNFLYENNAALDNKLSYLATIGTTAPFIGLLGTVFGIINSFESIGVNASASLAAIAPGIAEALYATALGLFVAIPAVFAYNAFNNKIESYKDLQSMLLNSMILAIFKENTNDSEFYSKPNISDGAFRSLNLLHGEKKNS